MSACKATDEESLTPPGGAAAIDLWAPEHVNQSKHLMSSQVFESCNWCSRPCNPRPLLGLRIMVTQKENEASLQEWRRRGSDEQRAKLWLTSHSSHQSREWVTYFLNKIISSNAALMCQLFVCTHRSGFSGMISAESRRFTGKTLQWPLDVSNKDACQPRTSGCPSFSPGTLPRGRMAHSQLPGIWMRSDIHLTSTQRWKWK